MKINFVYSEVTDLVFHFLAHMKVHNASDLYSEDYIRSMQLEKNGDSDIVQETSLLESYYNDNFERLGVINFLPFDCVDLQSFIDLLLHYQRFSDEDREAFLYPFVRSLEQENKFYSDYWKRTFDNSQEKRLLAENYFKDAIQKYSCLFDFFKKNSAVVSFSYSLTCNGRGIGKENSFFAIVPFPKSSTEYQYHFFQLLHEYTHQFTDSLVGSAIHMSDGTHDLSENVVIVFDYYLMRALDNGDAEAYFAWLAKCSGNEGITISEPEFLAIFKIPDALNEVILSLVDDIINT